MRSMKYALVLDLDDTLFLERDYVISGFRAVADFLRQRIGITNFAELALQEFAKGSRGTIFDTVLANNGVQAGPELVAAAVRVYRMHRPDISLPDDTLRLLMRAECTGHLAIVTDGYLSVQRRKVIALGLESRVRHIVYTDRWGRAYWKPHLRAFMEVERRVGGSTPERFVYVADNPRKDFQAPLKLGWWTVRIRREGGLHNDVEVEDSSEVVDREISSLAELDLKCLERGKCP